MEKMAKSFNTTQPALEVSIRYGSIFAAWCLVCGWICISHRIVLWVCATSSIPLLGRLFQEELKGLILGGKIEARIDAHNKVKRLPANVYLGTDV